MAEGTVTEPAYVLSLTMALKEALKGASVEHEQTRRGRYRWTVVSDSFKDMGHPERQRLVWGIADRTLQKSDLLNVAMILTVAPSEILWDPEAD